MAQNFAVMIYPPIGAANNVSYTGTSTSAQDTGASTIKIMLSATTLCHIRFGDSGVGSAVATDYPIQPNVDYVFDIGPGSRYFTVIRDATSGTLYWVKVA